MEQHNDEDLQLHIAELDRRERVLIMELADVLTDISTPYNSDVEGDEIEERAFPEAREALLRVRAYPARWTSYLPLYQDAEYRSKSEKKIRKLKNMIKRTTIGEVMMNQRFIEALRRIEATYPDDGDRKGINSLVACHHVLNPEG
jgi:hypothetical protein